MTDWSQCSMKEFKALRDLTLLFQENTTIDLINQIDLDKIFDEINKSTLNSITLFKKQSTKFSPININPNVAMFLKQTIRDVCQLPLRKNAPSNLNEAENQALRSLGENKSITIKASDKGGNIVVMDNAQYKQMCY